MQLAEAIKRYSMSRLQGQEGRDSYINWRLAIALEDLTPAIRVHRSVSDGHGSVSNALMLDVKQNNPRKQACARCCVLTT
jgi:hypothetical protein